MTEAKNGGFPSVLEIRARMMGRRLLLFIGLASVMSNPVGGLSNTLRVSQVTRWGMSEQQVQELFQGKLANVVIPGSPSKVVGLKHYDIDKCDCYVNFYFDATGLSRVGVGLNDETQIECPKMILAILIGKYGVPTTDEPLTSGSPTRMRNWYLGNTRITEFDFLKLGTKPLRASLSLYYEPTQTAGAKKL
jgi:hypothetical protein